MQGNCFYQALGTKQRYTFIVLSINKYEMTKTTSFGPEIDGKSTRSV